MVYFIVIALHTTECARLMQMFPLKRHRVLNVDVSSWQYRSIGVMNTLIGDES